MSSPIETMILGSVRCTICGAGFGKCGCWSRCTQCKCMYETGTECRRCNGGPLEIIAMTKPRKRKSGK